MATALEELRSAIVANDPITHDADSIILRGNARFPRKLETTYRSMRGTGQAYPLDVVYFQYKHRDLPYTDYVQACLTEGIGHIALLDKKNLVAYLSGDIDNCPNIVAKPPEVVQPKPTVITESQPASNQPVQHQHAFVSSYHAARGKDRDQQSLDSVLMAPDWDFSAIRDKLVAHMAKVKAGKVKSHDSANKSQQKAYDPRGDRYTSTEDRFWRENMGKEFQEMGIDMSGSFKKKPNANNPNNKNTSEHSKTKAQSVEKIRERDERRPSVKERDLKKRRLDPKDFVPIIIVPQATNLINASNAVDFLQHGHFLTIDELKKQKRTSSFGSWRARMVRTPGGNCSKAEYTIVSNPTRLSSRDWDRVVAVVCSGQSWQFSNWPINSKGVQDLFQNVQGFYFHYEDSAPDGPINSWAVKKLPLSRAKRYTDGQIQSQFWSVLDTFLARKGKRLRY